MWCLMGKMVCTSSVIVFLEEEDTRRDGTRRDEATRHASGRARRGRRRTPEAGDSDGDSPDRAEQQSSAECARGHRRGPGQPAEALRRRLRRPSAGDTLMLIIGAVRVICLGRRGGRDSGDGDDGGPALLRCRGRE